MRRALLCFLGLSLGWVPASCSGGGGTIDAGPDVAPMDVAIEYYMPETSPPAPILLDVVAGAQHTCVLVDYDQQNVVYCFGADSAVGGTKNGVLAVPSNGAAPMPNFQQIASSHGAGHTCAFDDQKQMWCWGDNSKGQCGQGNTNTPVATPALAEDFQFGIAKGTLLTAGTQATCLVRILDNQTECFGDNTTCESDQYDPEAGACAPSAYTATAVTDSPSVFANVTRMSEGAAHGCVVATPAPSGASTIFCWGDNSTLESGPSGKSVTVPAANVATAKVVSLATGDGYTCWVTDSPHQLYCFGKNDVGQSNPTSTTTPIAPNAAAAVMLPMGNTPILVATRANETCAVDTNGLVWCFGNGHGTNIDQVMGVKDVGKLALGAGHACAVGHVAAAMTTDPSQVVCWGDNTMGQAGQTAGGMITTPTAVVLPASAP